MISTHKIANEIESALNFGYFISFNYAFEFIQHLESVKEKIDSISESNPRDALFLYELFLSGCAEKIEEIDDSGGNLGMFFTSLFSKWVDARQKANFPPQETVDLINKWKENDDYGLCYDIEKELLKVFNNETLKLFEERLLSEFENLKECETIPYSLRSIIFLIKEIYKIKKNYQAYINFCKKINFTPKDCETIAEILIGFNKHSEALTWVDKGIDLGKKKDFIDGSSYKLNDLKREILVILGKPEDALNLSWEEYKKSPSEFSYKTLMNYLPSDKKQDWHNNAIKIAKEAPLNACISICVEAKEWEVLSERILKCNNKALEKLSHYQTEKAADELSNAHFAAAAKIFRALGVRIVDNAKSKYYETAWNHFNNCKKNYIKANMKNDWLSLVEKIKAEHKRKSSFMTGFLDVVSGKIDEVGESFIDRARKKWE